jgi:hypothetical protein
MMNQDVKDVVGLLMRVIDGADISPAEVEDLGFQADGELKAVLNDAYIKLMEFAYDANLRRNDQELDHRMRSVLQEYLDKIVSAWDRQSRLANQAN